MLCVSLYAPKFKITPTKTRSFCTEFKLKVTNWYFENKKTSTKLPKTFKLIGC